MQDFEEHKKELNRWFAIRVTYGREIKLKAYLDKFGIESFIPMQITEVIKSGKKKKVLLPAIRNLIFIHTTRSFLDSLKIELERSIPIRYIIDRAKKAPITVPNKQMKHFITLSGSQDEQILYLTHVEPILKSGMRVKVTDGIFKGVEGTVVRIKRDRRIMVNIDGLIAVVSAHIHPSLLEKINNP
ncbi:MAG: UpxY family transcription antiterminator [Dysgonomonas sp.]|nr:UpxY family transcription antiterminator [Dysgonomonas sp.]